MFDEGIDDIPSAGAPLDKFLCCDVCMRKDDRRRLAQIYCVICQKKFCTSHEKVSQFCEYVEATCFITLGGRKLLSDKSSH